MPVFFTFQDSIKLEAKRSYNAPFKTYNFLVTSSTATSCHARCGDLFYMVSPDWCSDRIQVRTRTPKQPGMQSIPNSTNHSNRWQRSFKDSLITFIYHFSHVNCKHRRGTAFLSVFPCETIIWAHALAAIPISWVHTALLSASSEIRRQFQ